MGSREGLSAAFVDCFTWNRNLPASRPREATDLCVAVLLHNQKYQGRPLDRICLSSEEVLYSAQ